MIPRVGAPPLMYTHGKTNTREYAIWEGMKQRCLNPNNKFYSYYGGRGIKIDDSWLDFTGFWEDMGECPEGHSLDRIDSNGDYTRHNCRWVEWKLQSINKRKQARNKSGKIGVDIAPSGNYVASIRVDKKKKYLGTFPSLEEATEARKAAELLYYGYEMKE